MKVLHVDTERGWRGGEQQLAYLLDGLRRVGIECLTIVPPESETERRLGSMGHRLRVLPMQGGLDFIAASRLRRLFRREEFHLMHLHTAHAHSLGVLAQVMGRLGPMIVHRRVDFPPHRNPVSRWKYRRPDLHFIGVSGAISRILIDCGIPSAKVHTVHSGIDPDRLRADPRRDLRRALQINRTQPILGSVGALVKHKGHIDLVRAMSILRRVMPEAVALIAGEGPERKPLETEIARLGLGGAVRLLGFRDDVADVLAAIDFFVHPSREEGLGTSVLDAMAAGLAVVATRAGGIPESVVDGVTGRLVAPGDPAALAAALVETLGDADRRRSWGEAGRRRVLEHFSTASMIDGVLAVYRKALGNR